jgi:hypothetical protein
MTRDAIDHETASGLLPWLVNGTLDADERERVERHVRLCIACRAELTEQHALWTLVRRQPTLPVSPEQELARLQRRIMSAPSAARYRRAPLAAAAVVALASALGLYALSRVEAPELRGEAYRTLSQAETPTVLIDVVFADISDAEILAVLAESRAEIVAGPSARLGRYTLRLVEASSPSDVDAVLRRLAGDERVRFAGRAFSAPEREQRPADDGLGRGSAR